MEVSYELQPKQLEAFNSKATEILFGGAVGGGKAAYVLEIVQTFNGPKYMKDVHVGDVVFDENGKPCNVIAETPIMHGRPCYRMTFDNGQEIVVDENHDWVTLNDRERTQNQRRTKEFRENRKHRRKDSRGKGLRPELSERNRNMVHECLDPIAGVKRSTKELFETSNIRGRANHSVNCCKAVEYEDKYLPVHPYVLGVWLGDGTTGTEYFASNIHDLDTTLNIEDCGYDVIKLSSKYSYRICGLKEGLKKLGILNDKRIPEEYFNTSEQNRLELLRGLMDTDGSISSRGACEFSQCRKHISDGLVRLLASLGVKANVTQNIAKLNGERKQDRFRVKFTTTLPLFKLKRKLDRTPKKVRTTQGRHYIKKIEPVESVPVKCIQVDSASNQYLITESFIPTHNSHLMRVASILWSLEIPKLKSALFRRQYADLYSNHIAGPSGYLNLLAPLIEAKVCRIVGNEKIKFYNGSEISLCHCNDNSALIKYQGDEFHLLMFDELTHFEENQYTYLRQRCRMTGVDIPDEYKGLFPRVLSGSNPGSRGHQWVKQMFIDPAEPMEIWQTDDDDGGMLRQFIPAKLEDNKVLLEADENYAKRVKGLGDPELVRALLNGDWEINQGSFFGSVWDYDKLIIPEFSLENSSWYKDRAYDFGLAAPSAVCWFAESDGSSVNIYDPDNPDEMKEFWMPKGSIIMYKEHYSTTGKANEGNGELPRQTAQRILAIEEDMPFIVNPGPADAAIWQAQYSGSTIAADMEKEGIRWLKADKRAGSRPGGWVRMANMMFNAKMRDPERPWLVFMDCCKNTIRTIPSLPRDPAKAEDVDTKSEDHLADAIRYRVGFDKPITKVTKFTGF